MWDYDKGSSNDFLGEVSHTHGSPLTNQASGHPRRRLESFFTLLLPPHLPLQVLIDLSNTAQLDNVPRWLPLKEQSEAEHHRRQGRHATAKPASQHSSPKAGSSSSSSAHDGSQDSPKSSVIKSRSHGIFPDPAKGRTPPRRRPPHFSLSLLSPGTSCHLLSPPVTSSLPLSALSSLCPCSAHQLELKLHAFCFCFLLLSWSVFVFSRHAYPGQRLRLRSPQFTWLA